MVGVLYIHDLFTYSHDTMVLSFLEQILATYVGYM